MGLGSRELTLNLDNLSLASQFGLGQVVSTKEYQNRVVQRDRGEMNLRIVK